MLILNENDGIFEELYVFIVLSERDSSGTTVATDQREGAKVMERIARRERAKPAKRLAPKKLIFVC